MLLPKFFLRFFIWLDDFNWFDFISYKKVLYSPLMYFYVFTVWDFKKQEWSRCFGYYQFILNHKCSPNTTIVE